MLRKGGTGTECRTYNAETNMYGWTTDKKEPAALVLTSDGSGNFNVQGLATGVYQLEEIKAQLPKQPFFEFKVTTTSFSDS